MISDKDILEVELMFRAEKMRHEETVYQIMKLFANKPTRILIPDDSLTTTFVPGYLRLCQVQRIFSVHEYEFMAEDVTSVTISLGVVVIYLRKGTVELK